jgi:peptide/nickel transport system permease protein
VFSTILYGSRQSIAIGMMSMLFAAFLGIALGLIAGYAGGAADSFIMRSADIQSTFPAILIAMLIDGTSRALFGEQRNDQVVFWVMVLSIGLSFWVQYARTVRGLTLVEKSKDYVLAARLIGLHPGLILFRHVLPNVVGPVLVIATINLALAIITEATLSFLGLGLPSTQPSLGTLIQIGQKYLFSGEWWIAIFPRHHARRAGARRQPARRLAARRPQPAFAVGFVPAKAGQGRWSDSLIPARAMSEARSNCPNPRRRAAVPRFSPFPSDKAKSRP